MLSFVVVFARVSAGGGDLLDDQSVLDRAARSHHVAVAPASDTPVGKVMEQLAVELAVVPARGNGRAGCWNQREDDDRSKGYLAGSDANGYCSV